MKAKDVSIIKPGVWIDFQGIRAFVSAASIDAAGGISYRLRWLDGNDAKEIWADEGMIGKPIGAETKKIGFQEQAA